MSRKRLPPLFAQALNKKRVELLDEFIRNNHNADGIFRKTFMGYRPLEVFQQMGAATVRRREGQ